MFDERSGRVYYLPCAAEVCREMSVGNAILLPIPFLERPDNSDIRPSPVVDVLVIVSDNADRVCALGEQPYEGFLYSVNVLVLVTDNMLHPLSEQLPAIKALPHVLDKRVHHGGEVKIFLGVKDLPVHLIALGEPLVCELAGVDILSHHYVRALEESIDRLIFSQTARLLESDEPDSVVVVDGLRNERNPLRIVEYIVGAIRWVDFFEHGKAERVNCADKHVPEVNSFRTSLLENLANPELQFFRGLFCKSECDYSFRIGTAFYKPHNCLGHNLGLSGSRTC